LWLTRNQHFHKLTTTLQSFTFDLDSTHRDKQTKEQNNFQTTVHINEIKQNHLYPNVRTVCHKTNKMQLFIIQCISSKITESFETILRIAINNIHSYRQRSGDLKNQERLYVEIKSKFKPFAEVSIFTDDCCWGCCEGF
jgi:hypothetical protein